MSLDTPAGVLDTNYDYDDNPFLPMVGKTIMKVEMEEEHEVLRFTDSAGETYHYTLYAGCCSRTWIEHINGITQLLGHEVTGAALVPMDTIERGSWEYIRCYSYRMTTQVGTFEVELRNSSNGYYGGELQYAELLTGEDAEYWGWNPKDYEDDSDELNPRSRHTQMIWTEVTEDK
jgi:hypothetical protein